MTKPHEQERAEEIEETILKMEAEAVLEQILESLRVAKGRDSVVIKETNYIVRD
jgi:hypothetical protein